MVEYSHFTFFVVKWNVSNKYEGKENDEKTSFRLIHIIHSYISTFKVASEIV